MRRSRLFPLSCLATLIFALSGGPLRAADAPAVDPEAELARAAKLHSEASAIRDEATLRFSDEEIACYQRFLVNRCIDQARARRVEAVRRARALDTEADAIELADKNRRFAERMAEQEANAPRKAVERAEQEAKNRAESEARLREFSEKNAERTKLEQDAKTRGMQEAEARHRREADQARRRAEEAAAAAQRAEQARSDKADYEERARKAAEKKAEKERKNAAGAPPATDALLPGK